MLPGEQDLEIYQGDDFEFPFRLQSTIWNAATEEWDDGPNINLGASPTVKAQCRDSNDALVVEFTCTVPNQSTEANHGFILVSLNPTETAGLPIGDAGFWDIEVTPTGGKKRTWLAGKVKVTKERTKA